MEFEDMFRDYIMSDIKAELIVDPELGYVQFQVIEKALFVISIYLIPEQRQKPIDENNPFVLLNAKAVAVAKERGATIQVHKLNQHTEKKNRLLKYLLWYGLKLSHNDGQFIVFTKEI